MRLSLYLNTISRFYIFSRVYLSDSVNKLRISVTSNTLFTIITLCIFSLDQMITYNLVNMFYDVELLIEVIDELANRTN